MSELTSNDELWSRVVPLAFHVDYWDYLGWPDRFAAATFSNRQREYALEGGISTVYTPGLIFNGSEWRDWRRRGWSLPQGPAAGVLELNVDGNTATAQFRPVSAPDGSLAVTVALLGFGFQTAVPRGENAGRTLAHDFVVLALREQPLQRSGDGWQATLPVPGSDVHAQRLGIAAWVHERSKPTPIQAVGGWLPET